MMASTVGERPCEITVAVCCFCHRLSDEKHICFSSHWDVAPSALPHLCCFKLCALVVVFTCIVDQESASRPSPVWFRSVCFQRHR